VTTHSLSTEPYGFAKTQTTDALLEPDSYGLINDQSSTSPLLPLPGHGIYASPTDSSESIKSLDNGEATSGYKPIENIQPSKSSGDSITGLGNVAVGNPASDDFTADTATNGRITVGGSSTGIVNSAGDRDWFRIALTAGVTYRFNLNGNTLADPTLALRNAKGKQLAFNDDFNGRNSQITFTAITDGRYYLDAGAYSIGTGSYTLLAANITPVDDFTADASTTGSIAVGGSSTGIVNSEGDRDWFRIALTAGQTYRFNLNGNTLADPTLALRNASGTQLAFNDDFNDRNSQITFAATTTGTYYLDAGAYGTGTGSYTLLAANASPADDFSADTTTTGRIAADRSRAGVVNFDGDRDWFRIALTAGQTYRFNLNGNTLSDPTLALRNAKGRQLAFNDDFNGRNSQITFTATTDGRYYLDAGGYSSGTGSYTLLATNTTPSPVTDDFAAGTTTAGKITVGGSSTGVVNFEADRDWFRVELTAGRTYRFNLNGNTLSDPTLALRNASGTQLAFNDDFNGRDSQITFAATTTGTYYLDAGAYSTGTGSYTLLAADTTPRPTTDDFAGDATTTGSIAVGGNRAGVVNFNGDRDWFRINLTAGRSYTFSAIGNTLLDPDLYLRDANGNQLSFADDAGGSANPTINFTAQSTGTYYLDVGSSNNVGSGSYTIQARDLFVNDDFAANNNTTGSIAVGGSRTGVVNFGGDRDWFRIALTAGVTYRFNLNGNTLSDPTLALRDASGSQIAFNDDFNGRNSQITFAATTTGTYYLDAGSYDNGIGSYTLQAATTAIISDDYTADSTTIGSLAIGREAAGTINFDGDRDWFRISLTAGRTYRFNLNGNTLSDPTLDLRDSSGRNILASNNNFAPSLNSQITYTAATTNTYYLDVGAVGSLTGTYSLRATDVSNNLDRITGLTDASIRSLVNTALVDSLFSHQELSTLLRTVSSSGVTSQELTDLRTIANQFSPYLSATSRTYHQYIFNAVVNGNAANQWWTGGMGARITLGNLAAGSSQIQMNRLVDKWFGGLDLPTNFIGGDSAAGANSLTFSYASMTGSLFVNDVNFADINQGQAGTCYFLAACSTLANNQRQLIRDMFRDNGDGTYGVRFYGSTGNELWVTVNRAVPILPNNSLALAGNESRSLAGEMWVALAEKAYAQANEIGAFGRPRQGNSFGFVEGGFEEALRHITNRTTTTYSANYVSPGWTTANSLTTWNTYRNSAIAAINAGQSLLLLSWGNTFDNSRKTNLVDGHAFAITGYNASSGRFIVSNPWGVGAGRLNAAAVFEASWQDLFDVKGAVSWV